jgi:Rad3-related DNA helicase
MSATLTPLDHQADRLGFARLAPHTASLPSPFERERRLVRVVAHIRTTFAHRDEDLPALARLVEETVAVKPGAYAVFFPSYAYLDKLRRELALPKSQLLVQLPASTTSQRARQLEELRSGVGTRVLLAVMGGVFAEGIDLPGDALSGAIVVGVGLPPLTLERLAMRAYYDARGEDGQACALVYPGLRKVVQAAGRVLRHCDDVGVVVLVGRRFADEAALSCLPEDWYRYHPSELVSADLQADLEHFWRGWQGLERHG